MHVQYDCSRILYSSMYLRPCIPLPDDEAKRKIKVEIKPVSNGGGAPISASVDELQKAVGGLELLPQPVVSLLARY